jgi:methionyl-tRNA formyltransferase
MGSSEFGIPGLEEMIKKGHTIAGIVSTPAREKGRGLVLSKSPVVEYAREQGYTPVFTPENLASETFAQELRKLEADVFVVVAFRILPESIFTIPPLGTYNIHASLLPRYRGPAPIQRAIAAGEKETGVTIFRINRGVDTGEIVVAKKTPIANDETSPQLSGRLSKLGAEALGEALALIKDGGTVFTPQNDSMACGAPKLTKPEGKISWDTPAAAIFNRIRAFKPFPGTYSFLDNLRIGIEWAVPVAGGAALPGEPGTVCAINADGFDVQCASGRLKVLSVKPEGKKTMPARDFVHGRGIRQGVKFS